MSLRRSSTTYPEDDFIVEIVQCSLANIFLLFKTFIYIENNFKALTAELGLSSSLYMPPGFCSVQ